MEQELGNGWTSGVHPEDLERCMAIYSSSVRRPPQFPDGVPAAARRRAISLDAGPREALLSRGRVRRIYRILHRPNRAETDGRAAAGQRGPFRRRATSGESRQLGTRPRSRQNPMVRRDVSHLRTAEECSANSAAFPSYVHPKDREKLRGSRPCEILSSNGPVDMEYRIVRPDGDVRFVRSIVEAIKDDVGQAESRCGGNPGHYGAGGGEGTCCAKAKSV